MKPSSLTRQFLNLKNISHEYHQNKHVLALDNFSIVASFPVGGVILEGILMVRSLIAGYLTTIRHIHGFAPSK